MKEIVVEAQNVTCKMLSQRCIPIVVRPLRLVLPFTVFLLRVSSVKKKIIIKYVSLKELLILKLENGVSEEYLNICLTIMMETCRLFSSMVSSNQDLRDYSLTVLWGRWS